MLVHQRVYCSYVLTGWNDRSTFLKRDAFSGLLRFHPIWWCLIRVITAEASLIAKAESGKNPWKVPRAATPMMVISVISDKFPRIFRIMMCFGYSPKRSNRNVTYHFFYWGFTLRFFGGYFMFVRRCSFCQSWEQETPTSSCASGHWVAKLQPQSALSLLLLLLLLMLLLMLLFVFFSSTFM